MFLGRSPLTCVHIPWLVACMPTALARTEIDDEGCKMTMEQNASRDYSSRMFYKPLRTLH